MQAKDQGVSLRRAEDIQARRRAHATVSRVPRRREVGPRQRETFYGLALRAMTKQSLKYSKAREIISPLCSDVGPVT